MPILKSDYAPDWPAISLQVREEAFWRCEWCEAPNATVIRRYSGGAWESVKTAQAGITAVIEDTAKMTWPRLRFHGLTKVVLTVAHLDRDSKNNDRANLAALCQRCHLSHDIRQHIQNRRYGRHHSREHQLKIF